MNEYLIAILGAIGGAIIAHLFSKYSNRKRGLEVILNSEKIALSRHQGIWGTVEVKYNNQNVENLIVVTASIVNESGLDLENVNVRIFTGTEDKILGANCHLIGTLEPIRLTDRYLSELNVPAGEQPSDFQWLVNNTRKEWAVPVWNRGQKLEVQTVLTNVDVNKPNPINVDIHHKGISVRPRGNYPKTWGMDNHKLLPFTFLASIATIYFSINYVPNILALAIINSVVGLCGLAVGWPFAWIFYKIVKIIK